MKLSHAIDLFLAWTCATPALAVVDFEIAPLGGPSTDDAQGIGLAFNNFHPTTAVPEPAAITLAALSGCGLSARRRYGNT